MDLEKAGVKVHNNGIVVDDHLQTSDPAIYLAGDVTSERAPVHQLRRFSSPHRDANALFITLGFGKKASSLVIPWATYTHPEVSHVGISHDEAEARDDLTTFTVRIEDTDRGRADGATGYSHQQGPARRHTPHRRLSYLDLRRSTGLGRMGPLLHLADIRSRVTRYPYGDQGLSLLRDDFERLERFPDIPSMEDLVFSRTLAANGTIARAKASVAVSGRRWQLRPLFTMSVINLFPLTLWMGISAQRSADLYEVIRWFAPASRPPPSSSRA